MRNKHVFNYKEFQNKKVYILILLGIFQDLKMFQSFDDTLRFLDVIIKFDLSFDIDFLLFGYYYYYLNFFIQY